MCLIDHNLKRFAEQHSELVSVRVSVRHPELMVVKYKNKVFYRNLWTPELREMRGLVIDRDWNVIVRPFTKVFNRFENDMDFPLDKPVISVRKINGFMAALTVDRNYGTIVSTTGSLDSPFVTLAEKYLLPYANSIPNDVTYLFEIVDPSDPHIVEEKTGAYLIGARAVASGTVLSECDLDLLATELSGVLRPEWRVCLFRDVVNEVKNVRHEGFMVHDRKGESLKIKSPYYLTKKFFARCKAEKLTTEWLRQNRENFDEEYMPLIDYVAKHGDEFARMDQEERKEFIESFFE
jgi:hypothetical protein